MRSTAGNYPALLLIFIVLFLADSGNAAKLPKGDLAIVLQHQPEFERNLLDRIVINLERELRERGYEGRIRYAAIHSDTGSDGENLVSVTVIKSLWRTRRAFSIPFIMNRQRTEYLLDIFMEISKPDGKKYVERLESSQSLKIQAQVLANDKYDPDLFPDQSERLLAEEEAIRSLAKTLADKMGSKLS